jgi:hypothetical protein
MKYKIVCACVSGCLQEPPHHTGGTVKALIKKPSMRERGLIKAKILTIVVMMMRSTITSDTEHLHHLMSLISFNFHKSSPREVVLLFLFSMQAAKMQTA